MFSERELDRIEPLAKLSEEQRFEMRVVSSMLPFRVNQYVIDALIDWNNIPADPIFLPTFPQRGMLAPEHFERVAEAAVLHDCLREHPEVTDVLFTGGDPMVMKTAHLRSYLESLLAPVFARIRTIRIGTKGLAFWPQRNTAVKPGV